MGALTPRRRLRSSDGLEVDLQAGELWREGQKIPLPAKPFQVLVLLLERPGEMVSRAELRRRLWPRGTHVDFAHNLNNTIARLRSALTDSSGKPRFIETVASRGYRFIGSILENREKIEPLPLEKHRGAKGRIRLAVLPFENLSPEPQLSWLSDGITEKVIVRLGHLFSRQFGVIARTSTQKYRGTTKDIAQIGRELKVGFVVEGSVQCLGDEMHITARLIKVRDQTQVWAESYQYRFDDRLKIQNEAVERIARALGFYLLPRKRNLLEMPHRILRHTFHISKAINHPHT